MLWMVGKAIPTGKKKRQTKSSQHTERMQNRIYNILPLTPSNPAYRTTIPSIFQSHYIHFPSCKRIAKPYIYRFTNHNPILRATTAAPTVSIYHLYNAIPIKHRVSRRRSSLSFPGHSLHMRRDRGAADDNGPRLDGLADGAGLAAGPLRPLHRGGRAHTPALQHARSSRLLSGPRCRSVYPYHDLYNPIYVYSPPDEGCIHRYTPPLVETWIRTAETIRRERGRYCFNFLS